MSVNRLDEIRARHKRLEEVIHRLLWRKDMAVPLWHQDRAYLLTLIDRIEALAEGGDEMSRLDKIRARHDATRERITKSIGPFDGDVAFLLDDRAYLLDLLDRIEGLAKNGMCADELTAILNTSAKEVTK